METRIRYTVWLTNFSRFLEDDYSSLQLAIKAGKATGFQFVVYAGLEGKYQRIVYGK